MVTLAVLAFAGSLALPPPLEREFLRTDANGDGRIVWHEAWAHPTLERRFILADRNHDGHIDRAEFRAEVDAKPAAPRYFGLTKP